MIDKGANPFIVAYGNETQFEINSLSNLSNLPTQKSIFFTIRPLESNDKSKVDFLNPWFYRTGVFDGKFGSVIGQGASGTVISGEWYGKRAAFKFVDIGTQKFQQVPKKYHFLHYSQSSTDDRVRPAGPVCSLIHTFRPEKKKRKTKIFLAKPILFAYKKVYKKSDKFRRWKQSEFPEFSSESSSASSELPSAPFSLSSTSLLSPSVIVSVSLSSASSVIYAQSSGTDILETRPNSRFNFA